MNELLPFDLTDIIFTELQRNRRPPDGMLHASSHITGALRHASWTRRTPPSWRGNSIREMPVFIGNLIHEWLHNTLRGQGLPYMAEVNVTPWLPPGWGGTADAVIWNYELGGFVLVDFKSQKGEGMYYIERDGPKKEHVAQVSAYYHALREMGLKMIPQVAVFYLPKNEPRGNNIVVPVLAEFEPVDQAELWSGMMDRRELVDTYLDSLPEKNPHLAPEDFVTEQLAPIPEREQRLYANKGAGTWDLKLVKPWYTAYCQYESALCGCHDQSDNKIGEFDVDGRTYYPRKGYEDIAPTVFPDAAQV